MEDCTTCKHCENCGTFFTCELNSNVNKDADYYLGHSCEDYEETDGLILVQVWDWMTK